MTSHDGAHVRDTGPKEMLLNEIWATLALCATGLTTPEVADRLGVNHATVREHAERARALLGTRSRLETVVRALHLGLIRLPPS